MDRIKEHEYLEDDPIQIPEDVYIKICTYLKEDVSVFGIS